MCLALHCGYTSKNKYDVARHERARHGAARSSKRARVTEAARAIAALDTAAIAAAIEGKRARKNAVEKERKERKKRTRVVPVDV